MTSSITLRHRLLHPVLCEYVFNALAAIAARQYSWHIELFAYTHVIAERIK